MYKPLSDSTLMSMTKKEIIENLRIAEHNFFAAEETLAQQAENMRDWVPVAHGRWIEQRHTFDLPSGGGTCTGTYPTCCLCGAFETGLHLRTAYCPGCGAKMDKEEDNA